jgi:hypothetical protein
MRQKKDNLFILNNLNGRGLGNSHSRDIASCTFGQGKDMLLPTAGHGPLPSRLLQTGSGLITGEGFWICCGDLRGSSVAGECKAQEVERSCASMHFVGPGKITPAPISRTL